jgi:antitoxin (DNA-binding transcriptional repressor) of toxin-antitoxin stability system
MTVTVEQVQSSLKDLIDRTARGEKVVITRDNKAVAELVPVPQETPTPKFGFAKGMLTIVSDDDEHLEDFKDYMP